MEYRLDKRETNYVPNDANNVKIVLAVSGAGKTRMLLELLYSNFGYYFITKSSVQDFGSQDLRSCHNYCDSKPLLVRTVIQQLYFVRATICAFLQENGFKKPWQILLAQLHPKEIFGFDIFNKVFQHIMKGNYDNPVFEEPYPYPFCAIDEIQISVENRANYSLPGARNKRPFFSPLVLFSKVLYIFPLFIVAGTGINFELVKEGIESSTMKHGMVTAYETISDFHPLTKLKVTNYATRYLNAHKIANANEIASIITSFELCHGRPRFLAYILDRFMESRDIDVAIGKFITRISEVGGPIFPLDSLKVILTGLMIRLIGLLLVKRLEESSGMDCLN